MSNVNISKLGWEVLRNRRLAEAIADAIDNGPYTPDGNGAIVTYEGEEFIISFWPDKAETTIKKDTK